MQKLTEHLRKSKKQVEERANTGKSVISVFLKKVRAVKFVAGDDEVAFKLKLKLLWEKYVFRFSHKQL